MVDMYKLAQEQAKNVEKMVELLTSIEHGMKVIAKNQCESFEKLEEIEERLDVIEAQGGIDFDDDDFSDYDCDDCDDTDEEEEEEYDVACFCDECLEDARKEKESELEEQANEDLNMLCLNNQLPYRFFGTTLYEYKPNVSTPIQIEVNVNKRTVVAMMKDSNGKVVKIGKSRCTPNDTFQPLVGAAIAVHRLFELDVPAYYL